MHIRFEFAHEGSTYEIEGIYDWVGFVEPTFAPDPKCSKCSGTGGIEHKEPPDEFNDDPGFTYSPCDCSIEIDEGHDGYPRFKVGEVQCLNEQDPRGDKEGYFNHQEVYNFVKEVSIEKLTAEASDHLENLE